MRTSETILQEIRHHGEHTYPEECCGLLLGHFEPGRNTVVKAYRTENRNENRREDRYIIAPADYRAADLAAREDGLDIVGIYHSHPDHPARPSQTDLERATFPGLTYVIVSIQDGKAVDMTAWTLAPDRSRFDPEEIERVKHYQSHPTI